MICSKCGLVILLTCIVTAYATHNNYAASTATLHAIWPTHPTKPPQNYPSGPPGPGNHMMHVRPMGPIRHVIPLQQIQPVQPVHPVVPGKNKPSMKPPCFDCFGRRVGYGARYFDGCNWCRCAKPGPICTRKWCEYNECLRNGKPAPHLTMDHAPPAAGPKKPHPSPLTEITMNAKVV